MMRKPLWVASRGNGGPRPKADEGEGEESDMDDVVKGI